MISALITDFCMFQGCNKRCGYCRQEFIPGEDLDKIEQGLNIVQENIESDILKISGYGEITILKGWQSLILNKRQDFKKIQLITNGLLMREGDIDFLYDSEVNVCLSLDGHTLSSNQARNTSELELRKIIGNLELISLKGIPLEINTVLTKFNIDNFPSFLEFLMDFGVICFPFPVRENRLYNTGRGLEPNKVQIENMFDRIYKDYTAFQEVLPPKAYIESLENFMVRGVRRSCYVPKVIVGIAPEGELLYCPCSGIGLGENIIDAESSFKTRDRSDLIGGNLPFCSDCFTHYELLNLFLGGDITNEEMLKMPLFSFDESHLKQIKKTYEP